MFGFFWFFLGFFTVNNTTPKKVVLSCFGLLVWLWQLRNGLTVAVFMCLVQFYRDYPKWNVTIDTEHSGFHFAQPGNTQRLSEKQTRIYFKR